MIFVYAHHMSMFDIVSSMRKFSHLVAYSTYFYAIKCIVTFPDRLIFDANKLPKYFEYDMFIDAVCEVTGRKRRYDVNYDMVAVNYDNEHGLKCFDPANMFNANENIFAGKKFY